MLKKSAILGLVLLLAGTVALQWVFTKKRKEQKQLASYKLKYGTETDECLKQYNRWLQLAPEEQFPVPWGLNKSIKTKTEAHLQQQQQERLKADLDKLAAGEMQTHPFADILYGDNWQNELRKYKSQKELRELIFTSSIVCTSTGATIFVWCMLLGTARNLIKVSFRLKRLRKFLAVFDKPFTQIFAGFLRYQRRTKDTRLSHTSTKKTWKNSGQGQNPHELKSHIGKNSAVLISSGWQNPVLIRRKPDIDGDETAFFMKGKHCSNNCDPKYRKKHQEEKSAKNAEKIALLLSDEKYIESGQPIRSPVDESIVNTVQPNISGNAETNASSNSCKDTLQLEDSLKAQAENLEKQMTEFKQMAKTVQKTTLEHSKPLNNAIKELNQQISAIREYAAYQQDRVEKLQDGYDWNIIRTFCLRVIRCIDNLENRINRLSKENIETADLEEVRDELHFALESSGVEQFEPEIDSDYRGQEKFAEAIKDKQHCDNPEQIGKIARVIKPGYQYFINEDNVKIVRTAQVKLFG